MEAWRSGAKVAITLETKPGTKPRTNKLETKLGTNLAASAWTQDTATRVPHASITKLAHKLAYCLRPQQAEAVGNA